MVPWAHPSSQPKQHLDQFSRFCTAHVSVVQHVGTCPSPSKSLLPMNKSGVPSNMWFPGSIRFSIPNYTSISSAIFAQLMADSPIHMIAYFITVILHLTSYKTDAPNKQKISSYQFWTNLHAYIISFWQQREDVVTSRLRSAFRNKFQSFLNYGLTWYQ